MRVLNYVRAGQAPMQRWRHVQPVYGEAFFHAFSQAVGGVRMLSFQPLRQFFQLRHARFGSICST
jgi:hypothetical protein